MSSKDNSEARVVAAAAKLKQQLEQLVSGKSKVWMYTNYRIIGISSPTYDGIGNFRTWFCVGRADSGVQVEMPLRCVIPSRELYGLFRSTFLGLNVPLLRPTIAISHDDPGISRSGSLVDRDKRHFKGSGRRVIISDRQSACLRPIGDLSASPWMDVELVILAKQRLAVVSDPLVPGTVSVVPHVLVLDGLPEVPWENYADDTALCIDELPTVYVELHSDEYGGTSAYLPVARLVDANLDRCEMTFELDESVTGDSIPSMPNVDASTFVAVPITNSQTTAPSASSLTFTQVAEVHSRFCARYFNSSTGINGVSVGRDNAGNFFLEVYFRNDYGYRSMPSEFEGVQIRATIVGQ